MQHVTHVLFFKVTNCDRLLLSLSENEGANQAELHQHQKCNDPTGPLGAPRIWYHRHYSADTARIPCLSDRAGTIPHHILYCDRTLYQPFTDVSIQAVKLAGCLNICSIVEVLSIGCLMFANFVESVHT